MDRWQLRGMANSRWMCFIDGENLTLRGQQVAAAKGITLKPGTSYVPDVFLWFPRVSPINLLNHSEPGRVPLSEALRTYYYTSLVGDAETLVATRASLWNLGFSPSIFKRQRGQAKSKGVDIALCTDALSHSFRQNFDVMCLIAGDGDYVPLVEEVKRLGKTVVVAFFTDGLSDDLKLAADDFINLEAPLVHWWTAYPDG